MMEILWKFQYPENIVNCTKICVKSPVNPIFNEKLLVLPRSVYICALHACSINLSVPV